MLGWGPTLQTKAIVWYYFGSTLPLLYTGLKIQVYSSIFRFVKGAVSRNSAKLGNYKMPVRLRET